MRSLSLAILLLSSAAFAQESTPFAQQTTRAGGDASLTSLSDMMAVSQMRHIKLWQAGKLENWALATYEADKLKETLYRAAGFYTNIPAPLIIGADAPLTALKDAASGRDQRAFQKAFAELTTSCNACHQAAGLDFIRMRTPSASPFSDQDFAPIKPAR